jgi:hypothetical protein
MKTYPSHWKIRAKSRNFKVEDMWVKMFKCEWIDCTRNACEIHHIECSYRGNKKRNEKPEQLIWLCKIHHDWIHAHNTFENRNMVLSFTKHHAENNDADILGDVS